MNDSTRSIFTSASRFFSGTLFSRITGMVRDMGMAFAFGTGADVAAFFVAYRFAHLLRRLFGEGALQSAFIPLFESLRQQDPKRAGRFFIHLKIAVTVLLVAIIILSMLGLGSYLLWGHIPASQQEIVTLTLIMLPSLLFICLYGLNSSLLQCHQSYFIPAFSPTIFNIVWIFGILGLAKTPEHEAMPYLAGCIVLASISQWLFTLPATAKILKNYPCEKSKEDRSDLWQIGSPMILGIIGIAASQINNFLDAVFARFASLEGPALLWYSVRIQQLPLALFGIALAGAVLPPLARAFKAGQVQQYRDFLLYALKYTSLFLIPCTFGMLSMGLTGISIIYARGDFGLDSMTGTVYCLWAYAIGLVPMGLVQILAPAYYAQGNYKTPSQASVFAMALNIALNAWFVFGLGYGAMSIAIATGIAAWANAALLFIGLLSRGAISPLLPFLKTFGIALAAALVGSGLVFLDGHSMLPLLEQSELLLAESLWHRSLDFLTQTALFSLGVGGVLYVTRKREFWQ